MAGEGDIYAFLFIIYVAISGFAILNLIVGIVCEKTMAARPERLAL